MKMIHSIILAASLILSFPLQASEESHREAAKQMVEVANLDKMLAAMYQQINTVIVQNVIAKDPCLESLKEPLNKLMLQYDQKILNSEIVKAEIQKVYQTEFTEEEIKQIVAFYKTSAGKKALEKAPILAAKGMEIAQKEIDKNKNLGVMEALQKDINNLIQNIDVKKLSPDCKKKFEERKQKTEEAAKAGATAPATSTSSGGAASSALPAAGAAAAGAAAGAAASAVKADADKSVKTESKAAPAKADKNNGNGKGKTKTDAKSKKGKNTKAKNGKDKT